MAPRISAPVYRGGGGVNIRSFSHRTIQGGIYRSYGRPAIYGTRSFTHRYRGVGGRTAIHRTGGRTLVTGPSGTVRGTRATTLAQGARLHTVRGARTAKFAQGSTLRTFHGARTATFAQGGKLATLHGTHTHPFRHGHWRWRYPPRYYGWYGPVFWPYAYYDFFDDLFFWGYVDYGYYDPFWSYGYGDIYSGLFSPYAYGDFAEWLPSTPSGRGASRARRAAPPTASSWAEMCGEDTREVVGLPIERIQAVVEPTEEQRAKLDELGTASVKAAQAVKAACPSGYSVTAIGRLAAMEQRLQGLAQAVDIMRPPLEAFYSSLTDEQKARLTAASRAGDKSGERSLTKTCGGAAGVTEWPQERIDRAVRPTEEQRAKLDRLKDAAAQASDMLKASCPTELPDTPPARLGAVAKRIDAMLQSVQIVRAALNDFYSSLNDEQKAQFNTIGQARASQ